MNDNSTTFKDILLELMVVNETADKIVKNTANLGAVIAPAPASASAAAAPDTKAVTARDKPESSAATGPGAMVMTARDKPESSAATGPGAMVMTAEATKTEKTSEAGDYKPESLQCCDEILKCVKECEISLKFLCEETVFSGSVLIQIRNGIMGMRIEAQENAKEMRRAAELAKLQNLEKKEEAGKTEEKKAVEKYPLFDTRMLKIIKHDLELLAAGVMLSVRFLKGFLRGFFKNFKKIFDEFPTFKRWFIKFGDMLERLPTRMRLRFEALLDKVTQSKMFMKLEDTIVRLPTRMKLYFEAVGKNLNKAISESSIVRGIRNVAQRVKGGIGRTAGRIAARGSSLMARVRYTAAVGAENVSNFIKQFKAEAKASMFWKDITGFFTKIRGFGTRLLGFANQFKAEAKASMFWKDITSVFTKVSEIPAKIGTKARGFLSSTKMLLADWGKGLNTAKNVLKEGAKETKLGLIEGFGKLFKAFQESRFTKALTTLSSKFGGMISSMFRSAMAAKSEIGGQLSNIWKSFTGLFEPILKMPVIKDIVTKWGPRVEILGRRFGRLAKGTLGKAIAPAMAMYDMITGFNEAYDKTEGDKLTKAAAGGHNAAIKAINGFAGIFFDVPKMLTSWALGKLGFKGAEKFLDSINFKDTIATPFVNMIESLFALIFKGILLIPGLRKLLGLSTDATIELNTDRAGKKPQRDPTILQNAAKTLLNPDLKNAPNTLLKTREIAKSYGFADAEIDSEMQRISAQNIVSPQSTTDTAKKDGATIAAYQADTQQAKDAAAQTVVVSARGAPAAAPVNNSSVNSVTYNNTALPDRTNAFVMPALGY